MELAKELLEMKQEIEDAEIEKGKIDGKIEAQYDQLNELCKVKTVDEAEKLLKEFKSESQFKKEILIKNIADIKTKIEEAKEN